MGGWLRATITVFEELLSLSILDMKKDGMEVNGNIKMMVPQVPFQTLRLKHVKWFASMGKTQMRLILWPEFWGFTNTCPQLLWLWEWMCHTLKTGSHKNRAASLIFPWGHTSSASSGGELSCPRHHSMLAGLFISLYRPAWCLWKLWLLILES